MCFLVLWGVEAGGLQAQVWAVQPSKILSQNGKMKNVLGIQLSGKALATVPTTTNE